MKIPALDQLLRGYELNIRSHTGDWVELCGDDFAEALALPDGTLLVVDLAGKRTGHAGTLVAAKGTYKVWAVAGGETRRFDHVNRLYVFPDERINAIDQHGKRLPIRGRVVRVKRQYL